jgi:hypothetical protein
MMEIEPPSNWRNVQEFLLCVLPNLRGLLSFLDFLRVSVAPVVIFSVSRHGPDFQEKMKNGANGRAIRKDFRRGV